MCACCLLESMKSKMSRKRKTKFDEDAWLIRQPTNGDFMAFEGIYKKYFPIVAGYLTNRNGNHSLSDDLAQEVFIRYLKNNMKFRDESAFKAYIFGIAKNILREHYRHIRCESVLHQHLSWSPE